MLKLLKKLRRNERGNVLILTAAAMPLLVGSAGLAVDTIQWTLWKRQLQRAADSAALAGVYQHVQIDNEAEVKTAVSRDLTFNQNTGITLYAGYPQVQLLPDSGTQRKRVQVGLGVQKTLSFSSMFMSAAPIITANATAATVPGDDEYCFVATENSASKTGITIGGSSKIEMDCGMISNSPATNSALSNGSASRVKASVIAAVGGVEKSNNWDVPKYDPYVPPIADPYANVNIDRNQMKCFNSGTKYPDLGTSTSSNFNGANATVTLTDARATTGHADANCFGGLKVPAGGSMTLPSGTYYIGEGGMDVQGALNCTNCTFVLTNIDPTKPVGQLKVNANPTSTNGVINIEAPKTGNYSGIAIFQDRNATDVQGNRINGSSDSKIVGAIYFPKQEITYNGDGTAGFTCTRLVGRRLVFSGNSGLVNQFAKGSECDVFGNKGLTGGIKVRLVA